MTTRITKESLFLRRDFTADERLEMGAKLAQAHNRIAAIDDEEKSMKASIKDRKAGVELTIGSLSRKLNDGYEMENFLCSLTYDEPNLGEVTYRRPDGSVVKSRAMTIDERQEELPFEEIIIIPPAQAEASAEKSAENIEAFFDANVVPEPDLPDNFESDVRKSLGTPEPFPATLKEQLAIADALPVSKTFEELYELSLASMGKHKKMGASIMQRELHISYVQASHLLDRMKERGLIDADGNVIPKKSGPKELAAEHERQTAAAATDIPDGW